MTASTVFISYSHISADQFIAAALTWFGDPDPTQGSPWGVGVSFLGNLLQSEGFKGNLHLFPKILTPTPPWEEGKRLTGGWSKIEA